MRELTDEQVEILFLSYGSIPSDDTLREYLQSSNANEATAEALPEGVLKDMGYSDQEIEEIREGVKGG